MARFYYRVLVLIASLTVFESALAESYILIGPSFAKPTMTVSVAGTVGISITDEADRLDVELSLILDDIIDFELDHDDDSCLYVSPSTVCGVSASFTPYTENCEYCGDLSWDLLRNDESNPANPPDWNVFHSSSVENCITAPSPSPGGPR